MYFDVRDMVCAWKVVQCTSKIVKIGLIIRLAFQIQTIKKNLFEEMCKYLTSKIQPNEWWSTPMLTVVPPG